MSSRSGVAHSRRAKPKVYYTFGDVSCELCASTHVDQLGLTQALFHERWCPRAGANEGLPVHPTRYVMVHLDGADGAKSWRRDKLACNGAIRFDNRDRLYWCQRCNDRSTILNNLIVEG